MSASQSINKVVRVDDGELLGYVVDDGTSWRALSLFGYTIARFANRTDAEEIVHRNGLTFLTGMWQYYDKDDRDWHSCVIKEAYESRVIVIRTNEMGYQDPDVYKLYTVQNPSEENLIKVT